MFSLPLAGRVREGGVKLETLFQNPEHSLKPCSAFPPEWRVAPDLAPYPDALAIMESRVDAIESGAAPELVWLLEHPPLYTAGTSAEARDLLDSRGFPVYATGRGGQYTYHGPGQRVVYILSDLRRRNRDVRAHVCRLEEWVIQTLRDFGIDGQRRQGRVGIWVDHKGREEKIAAIGVRVRRWITYHGLALNVAPDLSHFGGIVPCGLPDYGVTSMQAMGCTATMAEVDKALLRHYGRIFGE